MDRETIPDCDMFMPEPITLLMIVFSNAIQKHRKALVERYIEEGFRFILSRQGESK